MKKLKLMMMTLMMCFVTSLSFSQENFNWDKIDSTTKTKDEIYSITKMFIGETWKSSQDVIQNDDKDGGMILVKGLSIQTLFYQMTDHRWTFSYNIKFMFKDNKYRIVISDIYCQSARCGVNEWPKLLVSDTYPEKRGLILTSLNEERYLEVMSNLKTEFQNIVNRYEKNINTIIGTNNNW